jgi:hypothetical protein
VRGAGRAERRLGGRGGAPPALVACAWLPSAPLVAGAWLSSAALVACAWLASAGLAAADVFGDEEPEIADVVDVVVLGRELVAFDAVGSGQTVLRLERDEDVRWTGAQGRVGVAITDRRVLAVTPDASSWREERLHLGESPPERAKIGARVALALTAKRALGFDGGSNNWVETRLGVREKIVSARVAENTAVVVTDRRALGLSRQRGGFFEADLNLRERLERVDAKANMATVTTSRRVLLFQGGSGVWTYRKRPLH